MLACLQAGNWTGPTRSTPGGVVFVTEARNEGHRQRLRQRFKNSGLSSFADYETIELLLTLAVPRRDVKPVAKAAIERFASLGTTEHESGTQFKVDYIKPSGAIGFYYPDWVAFQETPEGEVNWIIETKGRVWESTPIKDDAICDWCARVSEQTGTRWEYVRVNQLDFVGSNFSSFADLVSKMPFSTR